MSELQIRRAVINDVQDCLAIYNYEVEHGVATLDLEPRTLEEWHEWYNAHSDEHHPIIVGTIDDVVVGYASLSPYRLKDAFKSTVELSIYIHQDYRGQGVATQLMDRIIAMAKSDTIHCIMWCPLLRPAMKRARNYIVDSALPIVGLPLRLVLNMENIRIPKLTHYWYNNRY